MASIKTEIAPVFNYKNKKLAPGETAPVHIKFTEELPAKSPSGNMYPPELKSGPMNGTKPPERCTKNTALENSSI